MRIRPLEALLQIPDNPPVAPECFVLPSYALRDCRTPTLPTRAQIDVAVAWWRKHPKAVLIMCTGDNQGLGVTNAAVMADYAAARGVPRESIIEEDRSLNTVENLRNARSIVQGNGFREATLVTTDLYTRRAVATARRLGWSDLRWLSAWSEGEPAHGWKRFQTRSRTTILLYEIGASAYSRVVGWT